MHKFDSRSKEIDLAETSFVSFRNRLSLCEDGMTFYTDDQGSMDLAQNGTVEQRKSILTCAILFAVTPYKKRISGKNTVLPRTWWQT